MQRCWTVSAPGCRWNHRYILDGVVLTPPDQTYDGNRATLDLGGRRVEFRTWGTAHSPGDQIVHLPEERIVFIGDLIEERMFPIVPFFPPMILANDIDVARWEVVLNDVLSFPAAPDRAGPRQPWRAGDRDEPPGLLQGSSGSLRDHMVCRAVELDQRLRAKYPTWEHSEYIAPARQYFAQLPI